jgi:hypothetical protein
MFLCSMLGRGNGGAGSMIFLPSMLSSVRRKETYIGRTDDIAMNMVWAQSMRKPERYADCGDATYNRYSLAW